METHKKREKQLPGTLLNLSHELLSCPSHGHTVTMLGLLAGGRDPIPAPSAIAGVVSRVGSLERSVEFHEDAILEVERQGSVVDSLVAKVEEMDQLLAQLEQLSDRVNETKALVGLVDEGFSAEVKGASLVVAEFGVELQKRERDFGELASFVDALGRLHDDLKDKVLHVDHRS